ncbi:hypothetical protein CPB97_003905, partial [Podila verticillata]
MNQDSETISQDYDESDSLNIVNQNDESDKHGDSENTDPNGDENFYCSADDEDFFGLNQDRQDEDGEEEFVDPVVVEGRQDDIEFDADLDVVHKRPSLHSADPGGNSSSDSDGPLTKSPTLRSGTNPRNVAKPTPRRSSSTTNERLFFERSRTPTRENFSPPSTPTGRGKLHRTPKAHGLPKVMSLAARTPQAPVGNLSMQQWQQPSSSQQIPRFASVM